MTTNQLIQYYPFSMPSFIKSKNSIVFVVIIILLAITSIYFFVQYQKSQSLFKSSNTVSREEIKDLLEKLGKIIELPAEEPTVATVSDKKKLLNQPFFKNAQNGDKVIIFTQAKKAILYRSSINKIIEVATVNLGSTEMQNDSPKVAPTPGIIKVLILNGTAKVGLTNTAEKILKEKLSNIEVEDKDNANKNTYEKTLVSYSSESQKAAAQQVASILRGEVVPVPSDEKKSSNILIILGSEFISPEPTVVPTEKP